MVSPYQHQLMSHLHLRTVQVLRGRPWSSPEAIPNLVLRLPRRQNARAAARNDNHYIHCQVFVNVLFIKYFAKH
jgi:hypothetical protein